MLLSGFMVRGSSGARCVLRRCKGGTIAIASCEDVKRTRDGLALGTASVRMCPDRNAAETRSAKTLHVLISCRVEIPPKHART
ncbi:hypothetical protein Hesp01_49070 [Herbidospora sp. NBRC 101105]|nr:hypothetical protein Hesp01_49070 [Herbidospora sp. NBRC 101105]